MKSLDEMTWSDFLQLIYSFMIVGIINEHESLKLLTKIRKKVFHETQ